MAFIQNEIVPGTDIAVIDFLAVPGLTGSQLEAIVDRANVEISGAHSRPLVAQRYVTGSPYEALMERVGRLRAERLADMLVAGNSDEVLRIWAKFVDVLNFYLGTKVANDYVQLGRRVDFAVQGAVEIYLRHVASEMNKLMGGDPHRGPWVSVFPYHSIGGQRGADGGKVVRVNLGGSKMPVDSIYELLERQILFAGRAGTVGFLTPAAIHS